MTPARARYKQLPVMLRFMCEMTVLGTVVASLGLAFWPIELFAHFRLHYAALLMLLMLGALYYKSGRLVLVLLLGVTLNLTALWPAYTKFTLDKAAPDRPAYKLITANLFATPALPSQVKQWIEQSEADFVVLLEFSPAWEAYFKEWQLAYPVQSFLAQEGNFGVAVLSKWPLRDVSAAPIAPDVPVASLQATAQTPQGDVRLIAFHPPPPLSPHYLRWRNLSFAAVHEKLHEALPTLVAGDFNATPWSSPLSEIAQDARIKGGTFWGTWPAPLPGFVGLPLDHIFMSGSLTLSHYARGPFLGSDHYPMEATFMLPAL